MSLRRVKKQLFDALLSRRGVGRLRGLTLLSNWFLGAEPCAQVMRRWDDVHLYLRLAALSDPTPLVVFTIISVVSSCQSTAE